MRARDGEERGRDGREEGMVVVDEAQLCGNRDRPAFADFSAWAHFTAGPKRTHIIPLSNAHSPDLRRCACLSSSSAHNPSTGLSTSSVSPPRPRSVYDEYRSSSVSELDIRRALLSAVAVVINVQSDVQVEKEQAEDQQVRSPARGCRRQQ